MLIVRPLLVALLAASCSPSHADRMAASPPAATVPATVSATPSAPAAVTVVTGATKEIRLGTGALGHLFVAVEEERTPTGAVATVRFMRSVNCHLEPGGLFGGCDTKYDTRKRLPAGAFTYDATLDRFALTTSAEGKPIRITWTGFGPTARQPNEAGALLFEQRDAVGVARWGRYTHTDPQSIETTSLLFRRTYAA